jgi:hypothetical protein
MSSPAHHDTRGRRAICFVSSARGPLPDAAARLPDVDGSTVDD